MKYVFTILITILFFTKAYSQDNQSYDYIIDIRGSLITAHPRTGSALVTFSGTDASVVIQNAINSLSTNTGGSIHITSGIYHLNNQLIITGWDKDLPPNKQLTIIGSGYSTQLIQNTPQQNAIVVKNRASIVLSGLYIFTGSSSKSPLLLDDSGPDFDISVWGGTIDNVFLQSGSRSSPALYAKNFFNLNVPHLTAINNSNHAIILENTSKTTNYGNSNFGIIVASASTTAPYSGLYITSSKSHGNHFLNLMTFEHFECASGYRGIYSMGSNFNTFNFIDIEGIPQPIYLDGSPATGETRIYKFLSGYLFPSRGGQAITSTLYTGGNDFNLFLEGDQTVTPVLDRSQYRPANNYSLILSPGINTKKMHLTSGSTLYNIRKGDGTFLNSPAIKNQ